VIHFFAEHSHREIRVDSYDVTIFPAESIKNSVSKKAKLKAEAEEDDKYSAWFFDLAGARLIRLKWGKKIASFII
jgi:hypothetical protein